MKKVRCLQITTKKRVYNSNKKNAGPVHSYFYNNSLLED